MYLFVFHLVSHTGIHCNRFYFKNSQPWGQFIKCFKWDKQFSGQSIWSTTDKTSEGKTETTIYMDTHAWAPASLRSRERAAITETTTEEERQHHRPGNKTCVLLGKRNFQKQPTSKLFGFHPSAHLRACRQILTTALFFHTLLSCSLTA